MTKNGGVSNTININQISFITEPPLFCSLVVGVKFESDSTNINCTQMMCRDARHQEHVVGNVDNPHFRKHKKYLSNQYHQKPLVSLS